MNLQIAYVANHGTRIDVAQNINQPRVYGQSAAADPFNVLFNKTAAVTQYFLGYSTNYESLQVQLTRRFTHGLAFTSAYTFGKAENYQTGAQDGNVLFWAGPQHRNYAIADFDRTNNFEQTATYELPAGHGHKYFNSGFSQYALGGWRVSAILSALSGTPFTISTTSVTPGTTQTANQLAPYQVTHSVTNAANTTWFNVGTTAAPAFCAPGSTAVPCGNVTDLGNTGRNQFRGPGYFSDNLSLFKSFPIFRESSLEARFDAFNLTNTPAFSNPTSTLGSNLGKITSTLSSGVGNVNGVGGPRVLQAAVKFSF